MVLTSVVRAFSLVYLYSKYSHAASSTEHRRMDVVHQRVHTMYKSQCKRDSTKRDSWLMDNTCKCRLDRESGSPSPSPFPAPRRRSLCCFLLQAISSSKYGMMSLRGPPPHLGPDERQLGGGDRQGRLDRLLVLLGLLHVPSPFPIQGQS